MKRFFLPLLSAGIMAGGGISHAQTILLKDGQSITALGVRRDGDSLSVKIKTPEGTEGEVGYPVGNVARVEFPDPAARKTAADLLAQNKPEEAIRQLAPPLAYYAPFRDIPGNWYTALAFLQVDALSRLGRDHDAEGLIGELNKLGANNPDLQRSVKIRQGMTLERKGDHAGALAVLEPIARDEDAPPESVADAWLNIGAARMGQRDYRAAALAYLHVPVYTPERTNLMPAALLGSGAAFVGLDDKGHAASTFQDLIARFPNSPEAADARNRLRKLNGPNADKAQSNG